MRNAAKECCQIPTSEQLLKKQADDQAKTWETLDDSKSLSDCGFSTLNAKAQHPAIIALCLVKGNLLSFFNLNITYSLS